MKIHVSIGEMQKQPSSPMNIMSCIQKAIATEGTRGLRRILFLPGLV